MFYSIYHIKFDLLYDIIIITNDIKPVLNEILPLSIKLLVFLKLYKLSTINIINININFYFIIKIYKL